MSISSVFLVVSAIILLGVPATPALPEQAPDCLWGGFDVESNGGVGPQISQSGQSTGNSNQAGCDGCTGVFKFKITSRGGNITITDPVGNVVLYQNTVPGQVIEIVNGTFPFECNEEGSYLIEDDVAPGPGVTAIIGTCEDCL